MNWLDRFDAEEDNFRAAIDWALKNGLMEKVLELIGSVWRFWYTRDHFIEATERMNAAISLSASSAPSEARLKVLIGLGFLLYAANRLEEARAILEEAARLGQELGSQRGLAEALQFRGISTRARAGNPQRAPVWGRRHDLAILILASASRGQ